MSRPELDIIRSPSAQTFLRMVTQGFYDRSATALWLYEVIGREWDEVREIAEGMRAETQPQTCTWSVGIWEWVHGIASDEELPLERRRQTLMRQICSVRPTNPAIFRRNIARLVGIDEEEIEFQTALRPYTFWVVFRPTAAALFDYKQVRAYLDTVKPSHLSYLMMLMYQAAIQEKPGELWFRDLHFWLRTGGVVFLDGRRRLDGSWLLDQGRERLWLVNAGFQVRARLPNRLDPSLLWIVAGTGVFDWERVPMRLDAGRYWFDNTGHFVRLDGKDSLDGSWFLDQRPGPTWFVGFGGQTRIPEQNALGWDAARIRIQKQTESIFGQKRVRAGIFPFAPNVERVRSGVGGGIVPQFRFREQERAAMFRLLRMQGQWRTVTRTVIPPPSFAMRWENPRAFRSGDWFCRCMATRENTGAGPLGIGMDVYGVREMLQAWLIGAGLAWTAHNAPGSTAARTFTVRTGIKSVNCISVAASAKSVWTLDGKHTLNGAVMLNSGTTLFKEEI